MARVSYAVVTPVRDDAANLKRLGRCLSAQTIEPTAWVIVDNGSSDGTPEVAERLSVDHEWVRTASVPGEASPVPGAPIVRAFHAGLAFLSEPVDVVVKVDADVSMSPDHFERLVQAFDDDPELGIAGGCCYELDDEGEWRPTVVAGQHVRGAVRAYRRECLEQLLPLPERTGWDTVDELQAEVRGWNVSTVLSLRFDHHRSVGERDGGPTRRWRAKGSAAHYVGYSPTYLLLRGLYNAKSDPAALTMISAYAMSALRREEQHPDRSARSVLRRQQRLRNLPARARELRRSRPPA
jgi:poly-beta-1,6-N-acetyl-D-glucosamine synthase